MRNWIPSGRVSALRPLFFAVLILTVGWGQMAAAGGNAHPAANGMSIVPKPVSLKEIGGGAFVLNARTRIVYEKSLANEAQYLKEAIGPAMGFDLKTAAGGGSGGNQIVLRMRGGLKNEGYTLRSDSKAVTIEGSDPAGVFYGIETVRQLLPPEIYRNAPVEGVRWAVPCVEIIDYPRFQWRGLLIDPARHFIPVNDVRKFIDGMALHKFNRLQMHLTDNIGWRIEIKKYPNLTKLASNRDRSGGKGGFYTQEEIRELVRYAEKRYITIVPEIEMPFHAGAAISAYSYIGINPARVKDLPLEKRWGVLGGLMAPRPETVAFMQDVLAEVIELFGSRFIHIGGDEANLRLWENDPEMQAQMKQLGCKDAHELHSWFIRQMDGFLTKRNRRLLGWDEILQGGLAPGATVMSWRGIQGGITAAKAGHDVVMAPTSHTYFDYRQAPQERAFGSSVINLEKVFTFEPLPDELSNEQARHVLGGQAQLWGELIPDQKRRDYMAYPRACALIETVWSPREHRDYDEFSGRLVHHVKRLDAAGIYYRRLDKQFKKNSTSGAVMIPNASLEKPIGFNVEIIPGWSGDHQPEHGNAWGTIPQGQHGTPTTPFGRQWAFISSDGFKDPVSIWTAIGTVEDNREYQFGFLAGKSDNSADYEPGHHYEVSIWAGDAKGPKKKLAAKSFADPDPGKTNDNSVKLNSGSGHAGQVLYLLFSKPFEDEWSQILIDNIRDVSPEAVARREARKAEEIARVQSVLEKVSMNPQGKVVGVTAVEPVDVDWLIKPVTRPVELLVCPGKDKTKPTLVLTNGLISRSFRLLPNAATVGFHNLMTGESILRAVKPEAVVQLDGVKYEVGGLHDQVEYAYLRPEWVDVMTGSPDAFQFTGYRLGKIEARFPWKRRRYSANLRWPPKGKTLTLDFESPAEILEGITLSIHYSMYEGIPLLAKWFTLHNGTGKAVRLDTFISEILAAVEYETQEYNMRDWSYPNMHVESDYAFYASSPKSAKMTTTHWFPDPQYTTHSNSKLPTLLESRPPIGPDQLIEPGKTFESFRTFELIYDSTERERNGLALRRMYRTISPWITENPILMHVRSADSASVRRAIDQCAEVGFEMVIMTFGSGVNLESEDAEYIARVKADADYAHSKGIELGGYSLLASRSAGPEYDCINPETGKPGGQHWGHCPCLVSRWGRDYFRKLTGIFEKTGMDILEHDGNYPGNLCASTNHIGHRGLKDSQWRQWRKITDFYKWCRGRGIYLNVPDWYFLTGSNKIHMNYKEVNNSLPRERQIILNRQNIYDGTWYKPPSMGWMFLPLVEYHGGGAAATIEPLHEHLDTYDWQLAQNFGSGVQACYRGPRLYDTDETKALVKKWVDFYKKYRAILDSDIIHVRRPDGRNIDCILHANPQLKQRGLAMVYNPAPRRIKKELKLPLYYTGLTKTAMIRREEGKAEKYTLNRQYNVKIPIDMQPDSYTWLVIE